MKLLSAITSLLLLLSSPSFCQTQTCLQNQNHPGYKSIMQITGTETISREYILHVPTNYTPDDATPLVINLHGFGDCASNFFDAVGEFYELNDLANQENFLVAYPQGAYRPDKEDNYWEPGDNGQDNIYENDIYFIEQLISDISSDYTIDPDKIYACGYSNGGMMTYSLACNRSNMFAAIGIMSGTMLEEDCAVDNPVPVITFHGIADGVLPYDGGLWYQSVDDVVNFWLNQNDIPESSLVSTSLNDGKVIKDEYSEENPSSCLTLYTINEEYDKPGDHVWFSDNIDGTHPNKIMWDFFTANCGIISSTHPTPNTLQEIKITPNPFTDHIIITTDLPTPQNYTLYNMQGTLAKKGTLNSTSTQIDLTSLPPNMYLLKIGNQIKKLVK